LEEALGDLGLHPWELWEYSFEEYRLKRKGKRDARYRELREDWQNLRYHAYFTIAPHLKGRHKIDKVVPDIYGTDKIKPKKTYNEIIERYKKAGVLTDGK